MSIPPEGFKSTVEMKERADVLKLSHVKVILKDAGSVGVSYAVEEYCRRSTT